MDSGLGGLSSNLENSHQSELELLQQARRNRQVNDRENELNIYRYGSAPPRVEGSLSAVGGLFQESSSRDGHIGTNSDNNAITSGDEFRSHPAYLQYYYSHGNVNPRLPPPALSKEDWRVVQRFQAVGSSYGGLRDSRKNVIVGGDNVSSLFSMQPGDPRLSTEKDENDLMELRMANTQASPQWPERAVDRLSGLPNPGIGTRRKKSYADVVQEGVNGSAPLRDQPSRPQSQNTLSDMVVRTGSSDSHIIGLSMDRTESKEGLFSGTSSSSFPRITSPGIISSNASASIGSSHSRNRTPEPQFTGRPPSSGLPNERKNAIGSNIQNGSSLGMRGIDDVAASLSGLSFSENRHSSERNFQQSQQLEFASAAMLSAYSRNTQQIIDESNARNLAGSSSNLARKTRHLSDLGAFETHTMGQVNFPRRTASSANLHSIMNSASYQNLQEYDSHYQGAEIPSMAGMSGERNLSSNLNSCPAGSAFTGNGINPELLDPYYVQYMQRNSDLAAQALAVNNSHLRDQYLGGYYDLQKAYAEASLARQQQYEYNLGKSTAPNQRNHGNLKHGFPLQHPRYTRVTSEIPSVVYGNAVLRDEQIAHYAPMRSLEASIGPSWSSNSGLNPEGNLYSSLLDEFKNNKTRLFELSDIYDHVVEFSTDPYGSRFIQQKLETATEEEKNQIFSKILPHTRSLATHVYGNHVIRKFFECGTASQRKELANQLTGYVLTLSLQIYGCSVIQKALEVVDVEQKVQMVAELDGESVRKCVCDKYGNHVIQKCIECVPQNQIQFIISSLYGQVKILSMHFYGCRVIQKVLECWDDPRTKKIIMDEIMQSVNSLALDNYGSYIIQYIVEYGKPHERSAIVSKLSGQVVRMSQHKCASNIVEKCLTFCTPEERKQLIQEIVAFTDEYEPLQAMMIDPFGNYVVQKVLETCDDRSLEDILPRVRVHLNTLKMTAFGKHTVSRLERLVAKLEQRRIMSSSRFSRGN